MDAVQFGRWLNARRHAHGWRSQRALALAAEADSSLCALGISEPFLARLEAGVVAHPFRGAARERVLGLAGMLCATRRQVREYLHAAELDDLTSAEEARVAGIVNTIACAHRPAAMPLPERPRILLGRESLVRLLTCGIEERPSGVYAITGMPGVG
ncbi:MAG: hypothetical protein ACRDHP_01880, partial [Ktedonobacterales bacterium]